MREDISSVVNTYVGNYCVRKCFRHEDIMIDCFEKFDIIEKKLKDTKISRKEFNQMMKDGRIKICKLPYKKRKQYVSYKYFIKINNENKDFWD